LGFSVVSAAAIAGLTLLLITGMVIMGVTNLAATINHESLITFRSRMERGWTHIEITKIEPVILGGTATTLYVEVKNEGSTSIQTVNFPKMDVILKYRLKSTGNQTLLRLPYNPANGDDTWSVDNVYTGSTTGEIINPIDTNAPSGQWDPQETLRIKIQLSQENAVDASAGNFILIAVSAPNGATAISSYSF